jgi:O-antigen/teichoic acid export membrane protein
VRDSVRHLSKGVAIYGAGDAAIQVVNFLLLAVYVKGHFLVEQDYGAMALIASLEMVAKIVSRWGLDGAFMRFFHERDERGTLPSLTSTIVWFTIAADAVVFGGLLLMSGAIGARLFPHPTHVLAFRLMLINTCLISLTFVPFHAMRMRHEATTYSALVFARSVGTVILRIVFVIAWRWGLAGSYAADLAVTLVLLPVLWRWAKPFIAPVFSNADLKLALRFGLPRLPHGLAQQGLDAGNQLLLSRYIPLKIQGVYKQGFTLGTTIRFFTSAFETAWAPFYYATSRKPSAQEVFAKMTTYGVAVLTLLVAVTIAVAHDAVLVMLTPEYLDAARVVPIIAIAMACQGVYLLTSIGLNLTSHTEYYPAGTFAALVVGLTSGLWLMPHYGIKGAAIAFLLSTLTQTIVSFVLARRFYPIPYETARLARVVAAGVVAALAGLWLVPAWPPLVALVARAFVTTAVFVAIVAMSGFLRKSERAFAAELLAGLRRRAVKTAVQDGHDA